MLEIMTNDAESSAKIIVVGVGGAGNNAVNRMIDENISGVEFIGIEEIGDLCGRFSYEFACDISPRVPRVYIKNGKEI